ncbi:uncharacterized protein LOC132550659 [Ylistrum balloti]|uniref:uncharacterized protein LOC132550659 n=1 Tax=Ylistrum balloti TaxID=509963 RepID=UPI002905933F|nr:uncharacterized protein LOC132550659 [Ylistrum balloti]
MACSGINEHHEARRRQNQYERKAFVRMMILKDNERDDCQLMQAPQGSYETELVHLRKLGSPPGDTSGLGHDPLSTDRQRREDLRQQQNVEYSAKLPKRFNMDQERSSPMF